MAVAVQGHPRGDERVRRCQSSRPRFPASTTHHFLLFKDGGAIDVSVKNASDAMNRDAIRSHLPHLASMFGTGTFDAPMLVHHSAVHIHSEDHLLRRRGSRDDSESIGRCCRLATPLMSYRERPCVHRWAPGAERQSGADVRVIPRAGAAVAARTQ